MHTTERRKQELAQTEAAVADSVQRVVNLLAETLEREILNVNKAAYSMPEPYQPACIAIGASLKRIADALRAECDEQAAPCSPVLCYVDDQWAYFTTRKLSEQWGDDWDDAPYEHNAGTPYNYGEHDRKEGREPWQILKVAWDGDFEQPSEGHCNSPWSVEQINAGAVEWLHTSKWRTGKPVVIPAGTTLERFCELIREGGGTVYLANDRTERPEAK